MDRTNPLPGLIAVLLAAQVYETGDDHTPMFIVFPMMATLYLLPVYLARAVVLENVIDGWFATHKTGGRNGRCLSNSDSDSWAGAFPASGDHDAS